MTRVDSLKNLLVAAPITGAWAVAGAIVAVAVPMAIRLAVEGPVMGCGFAAFVPAIVLSAIFLGRWHAAIVALASAAIVDAWLIGPPPQLLEGPCDWFGVGSFLLSSALIIGLVEANRRLISEIRTKSAAEPTSGGIVFSLEAGEAWASWYGKGSPVRLGPEGEVAEMMKDFLAQLELGKSLTRERKAGNTNDLCRD